jgi:heme A synthase
MIQRIQSVYLLLAGVAMLLTYFMPLATFTHEGLPVGTLYMRGMSNINGHFLTTNWALLILAVLATVGSWASIFAYKRRQSQMKYVNIVMLLVLAFFVAGILSAYLQMSHMAGCTVAPAYGVLFPLIAYVFSWMARRGIRKDEELVRSVERFR